MEFGPSLLLASLEDIVAASVLMLMALGLSKVIEVVNVVLTAKIEDMLYPDKADYTTLNDHVAVNLVTFSKPTIR